MKTPSKKAPAKPKVAKAAPAFKHSRAAHHTTIPVEGGEKVVQVGDYVVERDGGVDVIPAEVFEAEHPDLALPLEAKED